MSKPTVTRRAFVKATLLAGGAAAAALSFSRSAVHVLRRVASPSGAEAGPRAEAVEGPADVEVRDGEALVIGRSARLGAVDLQGSGRVVIRGGGQIDFRALRKRA